MNIAFLLLYLHFGIGLLEETDIDMAAEELDAVSSKWYTLGEHAGISHHELDLIHTKYSHDETFCLRQVLNKRINYASTTWHDIVAILRSSDCPQLADRLEAKYCSSELTIT